MCASASHLLKLTPIKKNRIWGGQRLSTIGNTTKEESIGEVYCVSAMPKDDTYIENENCTLSSYFQNHQKDFGIRLSYFPLRVNLIDAYDDLSIQVHPDDEYAKSKGMRCGLPEAWFILDSGNHYLRLGHTWKSKKDIKLSFQKDTVLQHTKKVQIEDEEFYYLPPGSVHAIGKHVLLYEITHQADITYRLYDYHRKQKDGKEREIHISQACDVIKIPQSITKPQMKIVQDSSQGTIRCLFDEVNIFTVFSIDVHGEVVLPNANFWIITVLQGNGSIQHQPVSMFETYISLNQQHTCKVSGNMKLIITTYKE